MRIFNILFLCIILSNKIVAQSVTIQKDSAFLIDLISEIEAQSPYKFFFSSELSGQKVKNINFKATPVDSVINWIALKTGLNYCITNSNKVVFTGDYKIRTNFAETYALYLQREKNIKRDSIEYYRPVEEIEDKNINEEYVLFTIGNIIDGKKSANATLSGKIKDLETGESLVGAVIYIESIKAGTTSDAFGFYSIVLPKGKYKIKFDMIGMKSTSRQVDLLSNGQLNIEMKSSPTALKEVLVIAKNEDQVKNLRMGMEKISMKTLKQLPLGMGEPDIIKSTMLLPGVQSVSEASGGFNVRGGSVDQNLILLNDAPIMNTSHFFGFFSGFNTETIKDITLFKSGIPAKYGGRVSSVLDMTLKDGNRKTLKINGGISPVYSRITIEAPIKKDVSSFIIGARTTYSDWVLKLLNDGKLQNSQANFYDVQGNFSYDLNQNNALYISGYYSYDKFDYYSEEAIEYKTLASTIKWKHNFSPKLFTTFSGVLSNYNYKVELRTDSSHYNSIEYQLNNYIFKSDFSYLSSLNHKLDFGLNAVLYGLSPGIRKPTTGQSLIEYKKIENEQGLESALYINDEFELSRILSFSLGLRYSLYTGFGPKTQYEYEDGGLIDIETITDTSYYAKNSVFATYSGPEYRISSNISLGRLSSIKIGFNRMYQYIHMISNTAAMSPTDIWKLSDNYLKPEMGDQYSFGFYSKLRKNTLELSFETYYKRLENIIVYKGGAQLMMNEHIETELINGSGKAYGFEFMLNKKAGMLSGWINYTYSRILHKTESELIDEKINNNEYFPANYDKPHDFKLVLNYKASRRANFSTNFIYSTGRPFTAPVAYYDFGGSERVYYVERNSLRMPDYIRLDFALTINGNLVEKKLNHSSWTFAVYNVLGRKNAHNIYFKTEDDKVNGYKISIFGQPVYTITYNFRIRGNAKDDF